MKPTKTSKSVRSQVRWGIAGVVVLFLASLGFVFPVKTNQMIDTVANKLHISIPHVPQKNFRLGLDLQSGVHLVYATDLDDVALNERESAVEGARDVIERRINSLGVTEPNIQTTKVGNEYRINVELPGITDVTEATKQIGETPILEFKEENNEPPRELTPDEIKMIADFNASAKKKANTVTSEIKKKTPFENIAKQYSEDEASKINGGYIGFVKKYNADTQALYEWGQKAKEGTITPTAIEKEEGYYFLKRGKEQNGEIEVSVKHILICYSGVVGCSATTTQSDALKLAQQVYSEANADNFAELVTKYSTDASTNKVGGDLGTFPRGIMIQPFEDAVFSTKAGQIAGPIETPYGYHIIYKTAENTTKEYEVSQIFIQKKTKDDVIPPAEPWKYTGLSGKQLKRAEVVSDPQTAKIQVSLQFDDEGAKLFEEITRRSLRKTVGIFLDGEKISDPVVDQVISGGQAVISGAGTGFNILEAKLLTQRLNAGALPVPVELVSQKTIGATLGIESLEKSLKAGMIGLVLVMIFMTLYYRLPGFISVIALSLYVTINLSLFKIFGVTLTLSGITGLILSIGMAVDANILIFERLKEELRAGKNLRTAVDEGFARAWTSIYDGNVATIITAMLLFTMNVSFVKGFAITLIIGTLVSMFTAITVTRILLQFVVPWFKDKKNILFLGASDNK